MYLCCGRVSNVDCEQLTVSQSLWTISLVLGPLALFSGLSTFHVLIVGQETLMLLVTTISSSTDSHNGFPPGGAHAGPDCGSTGPPLTDLWSNPPCETNINKHILPHTSLPNTL